MNEPVFVLNIGEYLDDLKNRGFYPLVCSIRGLKKGGKRVTKLFSGFTSDLPTCYRDLDFVEANLVSSISFTGNYTRILFILPPEQE